MVLAGGRCCRKYSSADGRLGPGRGGSWGRLLTLAGAWAKDGQLKSESADSDMSPEDIFDAKELLCLLGSTDTACLFVHRVV